MRINADTNVLLRYMMPDDDPQQHAAARVLMEQAESVYVAIPTLCELVWVLGRVYRADRKAVADVVRVLLETKGILYDRLPAHRGLSFLEAGGDFADAAIAELGYQEGEYTFASFDREAVARLTRFGLPARLAGA